MTSYDTKPVKQTDYLCLTAVIRAKETRMLTREKAERILAESDFPAACRIACECGYPDMSGMNRRGIEDTLSARRHEELEDLATMIPNPELLDLFRLKYDYHSAKSMVKSDGKAKQILSYDGRLEAADFLKFYMQKDANMFPESLAEGISEAVSMLNRTENPCLADLILDRAYFHEMTETAAKTGLPFAINYVKLLIDVTNLRVLIRSRIAGKRPEITAELLFDGGGVMKEVLFPAIEDNDALLRLFTEDGLGETAELGLAVLSGGSMTDFEKSADNAVIAYLADAERVGFGPEPVIAWLAALENEIMSLRIILTGKLMGVDSERLRERLRESYV